MHSAGVYKKLNLGVDKLLFVPRNTPGFLQQPQTGTEVTLCTEEKILNKVYFPLNFRLRVNLLLWITSGLFRTIVCYLCV